nr:MAG TPA: hypothetical protein [Caudoviricetes sp.]
MSNLHHQIKIHALTISLENRIDSRRRNINHFGKFICIYIFRAHKFTKLVCNSHFYFLHIMKIPHMRNFTSMKLLESVKTY